MAIGRMESMQFLPIWAVYSCPKIALPHERQQTGIEEIKDAICEVGKTIRIKTQRRNRLAASDLVTLLIAALPNLQHCSLDIGTWPLEVACSADLSAAEISQLPLKTIDLSLHAPADFQDLEKMGQESGATSGACCTHYIRLRQGRL
ncbi:hypothetical protein BDV11DRAFT_194293 [Aspergillus similis]